MVVTLFIVTAVTIAAASVYFPPAIDWSDTYRPASLALLAGRSPYTVTNFYNPPWILAALAPFALLPEAVGRASLFVVGLILYAVAARGLGAGRVSLLAFMLSPLVVHSLLNGNIEYLVLVGLVMPHPVGLFFVLLKPQIGVVVALVWLVQAWKSGGVREVVRVVWPVAAVTLLSFLAFGFWPSVLFRVVDDTRAFNASLFPMSVPAGLALLVFAVRKLNIGAALGAAPCLSPYVVFHAWSGALAAITPWPAETVAAVVGLWVLVVVRGLTGAA